MQKKKNHDFFVCLRLDRKKKKAPPINVTKTEPEIFNKIATKTKAIPISRSLLLGKYMSLAFVNIVINDISSSYQCIFLI